MARKVSRVERGMLFPAPDGSPIAVETVAWFTWLSGEANRSFSFVGERGKFTARKERRKRGSSYWIAYRSFGGSLYKRYLGKTEDLTSERLETVAAALSSAGGGTEARSTPPGSRHHDHPLQANRALHDTATPTVPWGSERTWDASVHDALVTTKLFVPPPRSSLVTRRRLTSRLQDGQGRALTVVTAPAGFGKTTLLSEWLGQRAEDALWPVAWVSLDEGDNDPVRFWRYVIAALEQAQARVWDGASGAESAGPGSSLGETALAVLRSMHPPLLEPAVTALLNALATLPCDLTLVLDDYHVIGAQAIHESLAFLVDHLPPRLHVVIASRTNPPFSLVRLRAQGKLTELRAADLRFTTAEAATFLQETMGLHLSSADLAALDARTEGWIVGLHLAALSMQDCDDISRFVAAFTGSHRYILDYLVEEVLRRQPEHVQSFLLQTSILDQLSDPLCNAVIWGAGIEGRGDNGNDEGQLSPSAFALPPLPSQVMLERLERANLFLTPVDEERRWYRYHHLFVEVLRSHLRRANPEWVAELHRRAGAWYSQHTMAEEAINHLVAGGDFVGAAALIEETGAGLFKRSEMATLNGWLNALPRELVRVRPRLCLFHAWALLGDAQFDAVEAWLHDAERHLEAGKDVAPPMGGADWVGRSEPEPGTERSAEVEGMLGEVAAIRSYIASFKRDFPSAIALAREALERLPASDLFTRGLSALELGYGYLGSGLLGPAGDAFMVAWDASQAVGHIYSVLAASWGLARVRVGQGHLHEAAKLCQRAIELATDKAGEPLPAAIYAYLGLGQVLYEWNDLAGAASMLQESVRLGKQGGIVVMLPHSYIALAWVQQAQGNGSAALATMDLAQELILRSAITSLAAHVEAQRVRLRLAQGDVAACVRWARERDLGIHDDLTFQREVEYLTLARGLIAQDKPEDALRLLRRLEEVAEAGGRRGNVIKLLALQALALQAQGNASQAMETLARGLSLAASEGYIRAFVDHGASMADLLAQLVVAQRRGRAAIAPDVPREYLHVLLAALGRDHGHLGVTTSTSNPRASTESLLEPLSERELEVLHLLATGLSNSEIAQRLVVTVHTVKWHTKNLYGKLDATNRAQAIIRARSLGLVDS